MVLYFILTSSFLGLVGRRGLGALMVGLLSLFLIKRTSLLKVNLNSGLEMSERRRVAEMWNRVVAHGIYLLASTVDRPHNPNLLKP